VQVNELWDSGVCRGAGFRDPTATRSSSTTATSHMTEFVVDTGVVLHLASEGISDLIEMGRQL